MRNARLDEVQAGIKVAGRNINNLGYADDTTLIAESGELKSLSMKVKGEWKIWLKTQHSKHQDHGIWSHHFMANRWANNGNSGRLGFLGSRITEMLIVALKLKDACSFGRKAMSNLDSILESRDITLQTKVHLVKAMFFPGVMHGCETIKNAECQRIDAFELWYWRLIRVPWTWRRSNQSILKEISPEYSLDRLMLKL